MNVVRILPGYAAVSREPAGARVQSLVSALLQWSMQIRLEREEVAHLQRMSARELGDIGLVRIDALGASRFVRDRDLA